VAAARSADAQGTPLLADLRAVGYRPLLAETLLLMAKLGDDCVDTRLSIARAKEAYAVAVAVRLDRTATDAAILIPAMATNRLGDGPLAGEWLDIAGASFERSGDDSMRGSLLTSEAMYAGSKNDLVGWVALSREAYEVTKQALGADHERTVVGLGNVGDALAGAGHLEEAVAVDRQAVEAARRAFGPSHPSTATFVYNTCEALNGLGRFAEARRECLDALSMWTAAGTNLGLLSYGQTGLGIALLGLGRAAEAIGPLELAVRGRVAEKVAPRLIGESRFALARALWSRPADQARARTLARLARADAAGDVKMRARIDAWLAKAGANAPR
jgi:tetratricopeptide (TPR) repeat protein